MCLPQDALCLNVKQIKGFSQVAALLKHAGQCDMPQKGITPKISAGTELKVEYNAVGKVLGTPKTPKSIQEVFSLLLCLLMCLQYQEL